MPSVLLVDDEAAIRRTFRVLLEGEGYDVRVARNADEALAKLAEARPDLVLLDVMMPGRNGFAVCTEIRKADKLLPVLFLTALDAEADQVRGFGLGADDYIPKATGDAELLARIRRALDRAAAYRTASVPADVLQLGQMTIDFARRTIRDAHGEVERLTSTETDLLRLLSSDRGRYFSADEIAAALRGAGYSVEGTTLRSQVSRLKTKLGAAGELIVNARGSGYALLR